MVSGALGRGGELEKKRDEETVSSVTEMGSLLSLRDPLDYRIIRGGSISRRIGLGGGASGHNEDGVDELWRVVRGGGEGVAEMRRCGAEESGSDGIWIPQSGSGRSRG